MASRTPHLHKDSDSAFQHTIYFPKAIHEALKKKAQAVSRQSGFKARVGQMITGFVVSGLRREGFLAKGKE